MATRAERAALTRLSLLDAGIELLRDQPLGDPFGHVQANEVARRAGVTSGAFFHHFATQAEYLSSLFEHLFDSGTVAGGTAAMETFTRVTSEGGSFLDAVLASCRANHELLARDDANLYIVSLILALVDSENVAGRVETARRYEFADAYAAMATALGREFRPPWTPLSFACLLAALVQGIAIADQQTPDMPLPDDTFGWTTIALIDMVTRSPGDDDDTSGWVARRAPSWDNATDR